MYYDHSIFRITTTSVCQDGELVTKNKEGSESGESNRYVNIYLFSSYASTFDRLMSSMFVYLIFRNNQAQLGDADSVSACLLSPFETPQRSTRYMYLYLFLKLHKAIKRVTNYK